MNEEDSKIRQKLGDILLDQGLITREQLEIAIKYQSKNYQKLGRILVKLGFITDKELTETLADQLSIPIVNLDEEKIEEEAYSLLPGQYAREACVLPLSLEGGEIKVAFADPLDYDAYQSVVFKTGHTVRQVIADRQQIKEKISELYKIDMNESSFEISLSDLKLMDTPTVQAAVDVIWHINGILKKIHQYSIESQTVKNAINWAYENIHQYLKKNGSFHLYISESDAFVNNERLPKREFVVTFIDFLNKVYLNSFSIDEGLSFEEFNNMIAIFNHCYTHPEEYSQISRLFRESGIINAKLGEIVYLPETTTFHSDDELISDYLDGKTSLIPVLNKLISTIIDSPDTVINILKGKKDSLSKKGLMPGEEKEEFSKIIYKIIRVLTLEENPVDAAKLDEKVSYILSSLDSNDVLDALISEHASSEQKKVIENIIKQNPGLGSFRKVYFDARKAMESAEKFYALKRNQIKFLLFELKPYSEMDEDIAEEKEISETPAAKDVIKPLTVDKENKLFLLEKSIEAGNLQEADRTFDNLLCDNQEYKQKFVEKKSEIFAVIINKILEKGYFENIEIKLQQLFQKLKKAEDVHTFTELLDTYKKIFAPLVKESKFSAISEVVAYLMDYYESMRNREDKKYYMISVKNFFNSISSGENLELLFDKFKAQDEEGRREITELIKILDEFTIIPLIKRLKISTDKDERLTLIEILVRTENKSVGPLLEELIMQNPWYVVRNAVHILGKIGNPIAIGFLKKALKHEDERVKKEAFDAMRAFKGEDVEDIIAELLDSPDFEAQCRAVRTLGRLKSVKYKDKLRNILHKRRNYLQDEYTPIYSYLCHALGKIKDEESVKLLGSIAKAKWFSRHSSDSKLRASACWALGQIGDEASYKILNKLRHDNDPIVRKTAEHALRIKDKTF